MCLSDMMLRSICVIFWFMIYLFVIEELYTRYYPMCWCDGVMVLLKMMMMREDEKKSLSMVHTYVTACSPPSLSNLIGGNG